MAEHFWELVNVIVENPDKSLAKLPILSGLAKTVWKSGIMVL